MVVLLVGEADPAVELGVDGEALLDQRIDLPIEILFDGRHSRVPEIHAR